MIIVGLLCLVIGIVSAATGFDIETQGGSTSFTIGMDASDCGHSVYIEQSATCLEGNWMDSDDNGTPSITYQIGNNPVQYVDISCRPALTSDESFEGSHDPPIRGVGTMNAMDDPAYTCAGCPACTDTSHCSDPQNQFCRPRCKLAGQYQVNCGSRCWVIDTCEELGEAAGGFMAMIGLVMVMAVLLAVGDLLLCIACCCCCQGPDKPAGPPVQGMVVGQPVGSA